MPEHNSVESAATVAALKQAGLSHRELLWCLQVQRRLCHQGITRLLRAVSRLGNGVFWYALMAAIAISGMPNATQAALRMALTGAFGVVIYKWLKRLTSRPRPCARNGKVVALTAPLDEFSFPSGHTLHAVGFSTVAIAFFPWLAILLVPFTLLVALSRVVLGLHYPSDVAVGAILGAMLAAFFLLI